MATLSSLRTILRRRVQEVTAEQWTNAELDELLNLAYGRVATHLLRYNPDAFISIYTKDLTSGDQTYASPPGFLFPMQVRVKDADGQYRKAKRKKWADIRKREEDATDTSDEVWYAQLGRNTIYISPSPTSNVAAGLELTFSGVPTIAVADDTAVPDLPLPLHIGLVYWAEIMAIGEGRESSASVREELNSLLADIPNWYMASGDEPDTLDIDLQKDEDY